MTINSFSAAQIWNSLLLFNTALQAFAFKPVFNTPPPPSPPYPVLNDHCIQAPEFWLRVRLVHETRTRLVKQLWPRTSTRGFCFALSCSIMSQVSASCSLPTPPPHHPTLSLSLSPPPPSPFPTLPPSLWREALTKPGACLRKGHANVFLEKDRFVG